jgi:ribosomal 50S subunit-associated protein YjgA (DUF615 family)
MDENKTDNLEKEIEQRPEKESTKTFTQSEVDQMIARSIKKAKPEDYDAIKEELNSIKATQKEMELAEKSEVEKLQALLSEANTELTNVTSQYTNLQKKQLRTDILNGSKYVGLPRAYKNMVELSDDKEAIMASADEVLEEFKKDTGKEVAATFGIPEPKDTTISKPTKQVESPEDMASTLRSRLASMIKSSGRG